MNLFRSEEHATRWSLYQPAAEDYIMPVADWARVFSGPLFRNRLDVDYLAHADEYLETYHQSLRDVGKHSPFWQYPLIAALETVSLSRFRVVGSYARYEQQVLNDLKDARLRILTGFDGLARGWRENHLIWAAPGSGKTFFAQQIAGEMDGRCRYEELNLAKLDRDTFRHGLERATAGDPCLCLIDEVDAQPESTWPYEALLPFLDASSDGTAQTVFVLAGSSGFDLETMMQRIAGRPKGKDLLSRIPAENRFVIPPMTFGDRVLIVLSQLVEAGRAGGHEIQAVEKLGLYYIALSSKLANARQLREFAVRAVERIQHGDDRVKYDHLFAAGDPENKRFWLEVAPVARELVNSYTSVQP